MNRRDVLRVGGVGLLAGCLTSSRDGQTSEPRELSITCLLEDTDEQPVRNPRVSGSWPSMYQNFRNTGFSPDEPGPTGCGEVQWTWSYTDPIGRNGGMYNSVVVEGSTMYIGDESRYYSDDSGDTPDNNTVIALETETGAEEWRFDGERPGEEPPVVHDDVLYLPSDGRIQAVDLESRELLWARDFVFDGFDADHELFEPPVVADDGYLYAGSHSGDVFGIEASSGESEWHFETDGLANEEISEDSAVRETIRNGDVCAPLALADDTVYVPTWGNRVYALDRRTGEEKWRFSTNTKTPGDRPVAPVVAGEEVYVATDNGLMYAVDVEDGSLRWEFTEKKYGQGVSPGVDDECVYVTAGESYPETELHALDRATHEVVWETGIVPPNRGPAVGAEAVFIGSGSELVALDKNSGEMTWVLDMTTGTYATPAIVGDAVFLSDVNGYVFGVW